MRGNKILWGLGCMAALLLAACQPKMQKEKVENTQQDTIRTESPKPLMEYGLPVDSFRLERGVVRNNEFLSQILNRRGVSMADVDRIARKSREVFDVRKIKSGQPYTIFFSRDSVEQARYFVYESSPVDYVVYQLCDSFAIVKGQKPVEVRLRRASGVVKTSLWNTMIDGQLNPVLALDLSDIFAWSIDFFAIQPGDRFRVIYDEEFVDSVSIGIGTIHAVEFEHYGEPNYAFRFRQGDRFDYFDENGNSLRKAFLKAPLKFSRISSRFSNSRMHPVLRIRRPHHGVDYAAPKGTPVMSIGDGTVIAKGYQARGGGNYLKIKHNSVYTTTYMHLAGFAKGMHTGVRVKQGQLIGYVGATGLATGPHLDFRIQKNGTYVDPLKVKAPPVEPVKAEYLPQYIALKDSLMAELAKIHWDEMTEASAGE